MRAIIFDSMEEKALMFLPVPDTYGDRRYN